MWRPLAVLWVLALGTGFACGPAGAGEGEDLEARLLSPVAEVRRQAEDALEDVEAGVARRLVQGWCAADAPRLRAASCRLRGRLGSAADVAALVRALKAEDVAEGPAATDALLRLARADRLGPGPPLPADLLLGARATRRLADALHERITAEGSGDLGWLLRLGEGLVPPLADLLATVPLNDPARGPALGLLGRIGGDAARRAVVQGGPEAWSADMSAWSDAVVALAPGPGLEEVGAWLDSIVLTSEAAAWQDGRRARPAWGRAPGSFSLVLALFAEGPRRERILEVLRRQVDGRAWWVDARLNAARALLSLGEPTSSDLVLIVESAMPPYRRSARAGSTHDALAELLAMVEPWREDEAVRDALRDLLRPRQLPAVHTTWCRYLLEGPDAPGLADDAAGLVAELPPHTARQRLGARLLDELGVAPVVALEAALDSHDPWLRGWALGRLMGRGGQEARDAAQQALADADDGVLLVGAESHLVELEPGHLRRLVDKATFASTAAARARAWRAVARHVPAAGSASDDGGRPPVGQGDERLDERLRLRGAWLLP